MTRVFTFFHTDGCELQTIQPLAKELETRGCKVRLTEDMHEKADVGIYCQHAVRPNANFSVIMLHDLAQRHDIWPNFWSHEPWNSFDMGLLPGSAWSERWLSQRKKPEANPRLGVFKNGWPKSDLIFENQVEFESQTNQLRAQLNLKHKHTILYAPSWENHGKQDDFVQQLKNLPVNLLLKQAPWSQAYSWVWDNISEMNQLHRGKFDNVHIIEPNVSIMYCIGISDLLVSDESSVLIEAALYGIPSIAVTDWLIPDRNPPRAASVPYENIKKITRIDLRGTVESLIEGEWNGRDEARNLCDYHFSELGHSSRLTADLILSGLSNSPLPLAPLGKSEDEQLSYDMGLYSDACNLLASGKRESGISTLLILAESNTEIWQVYNDLGVYAFQQNDLDAALQLFEAATQKPGSGENAFINLGTIQARHGHPSKALKTYGKIIRNSPSNTQIIDELGKLLINQSGITLSDWHQLVADLRQI